MIDCPNDPSNGFGDYNTTHPLPCHQRGCDCASARFERDAAEAMRKDIDLLAWIFTHPETAAEELEAAASGEGTARSNIENRRAGIAAARFGDA